MDSVHFASLPVDILLQILQELCVDDILALRKTCRSLDVLTRERSVWHDAIHAHVLSHCLPVPGLGERTIHTLSSSELEDLTLQALRFHRNWTSLRPICAKRLELLPPGLPQGARARNLTVRYIPGRGNRFLLTVTFYDLPASPRKYIIDCWNISGDQPHCIASLRCINMTGFTVNADPVHPGILALTRRGPSDMVTTCIFTIDFSAGDEGASFVPIREFPSHRRPVLLDGSTFVASDTDNIVRLINIETGQLQCALHVPLEHNDPTLRNEEHTCMAVVLHGQYVLTFCRQWIHMYRMPEREPSDSPIEPRDASSCDPIASRKWQWRIDTVVVSPRRQHLRQPLGHGGNSISFPSVDILIRFDTYFPWPVNILHHYVLPPNPDSSTITRSPHGADGSPAGAYFPYLFSSTPADRPIMAHSIPSPVRLFTPSDMVLGRYGTALWLDAQSQESGPAQAGDRGQRIAGQMLRDPIAPVLPDPPVSESTYYDYYLEMRRNSADVSESERGNGPGSRTMVFHMQEEDDSWNRLALDDEEGRIAVGTVYGKVSLFEYVPRNRTLLH